MTNICLNVEFLAGTDITEAITEAKEKALLWDVSYICFSFNGVKFSISRRVDVAKAAEQYMMALESKQSVVG